MQRSAEWIWGGRRGSPSTFELRLSADSIKSFPGYSRSYCGSDGENDVRRCGSTALLDMTLDPCFGTMVEGRILRIFSFFHVLRAYLHYRQRGLRVAWIGCDRTRFVVLMVWAPLVPTGVEAPAAYCPRRGMRRVWAFEAGDTAPTVVIVAEARRGQARAAAVEVRRGVRRGGRGNVGHHAS